MVGISGGKDSSIIAALRKEALGKDRVIVVLMPNGVQKDIDDSLKIIKYLEIKYYVVMTFSPKNEPFKKNKIRKRRRNL